MRLTGSRRFVIGGMVGIFAFLISGFAAVVAEQWRTNTELDAVLSRTSRTAFSTMPTIGVRGAAFL
jgi:acyl-CoA synthetase (AMP-forming)/AMP-acid ligase II